MIKRDIYPTLKKHLLKKQISVLIGPRQVGKTTLVKMLMAEAKRPSLYSNLDDDSDIVYFDSQRKLLEKIKLEIGEHP
jgi:predicted AAA+ superfamily ATPase